MLEGEEPKEFHDENFIRAKLNQPGRHRIILEGGRFNPEYYRGPLSEGKDG